jgi:c-di-GMP-binding flagellar brake protein YcgR
MHKAIFNGKERRSYVRVDAELPVRFRINDHSPGKIYTGATKNISQGGLCVEVVRQQNELIEALSSIKQQPSFEVQLALPDRNGEPDHAVDWIAGRLDWAEKPTDKNPVFRMGLGFVDLEEEVRRKLYDFVLGAFIKCYQPGLRARPPLYAVR